MSCNGDEEILMKLEKDVKPCSLAVAGYGYDLIATVALALGSVENLSIKDAVYGRQIEEMLSF